jgi:Mn2+/Fe2+ NRAMP family transporter
MDEMVNTPVIKILGWFIVVVVVVLNLYLLFATLFG